MKEYKVSVCIPVYNAEKFIRKAVESALHEEETGEVILIEDASPDNALEVCRQLAAESDKVKVYQHADKKNHGAAASMNLAIEKSTCDYVAILGADDFFLPGRFKKEKGIFLSDPTVEGVYHPVEAYPLDRNGENRMKGHRRSGMKMDKIVPPEVLFEHMEPIGIDGFFSLDGLTVKRSVFDKTGLLDVKLRLSQDTDISVKMVAVCKLVAGETEKPVALYGVHENNRSQFQEKLTNNRPYLFYELYKWARKKNIKQSRIFILWQRYYEYNLLVNKLTRREQKKILLNEFLKNPGLLFSRYFRKQLPVLSRLMS